MRSGACEGLKRCMYAVWARREAAGLGFVQPSSMRLIVFDIFIFA